ncbi:NUDIX domain-containing protein [Nannocystis pusilla]|uniref:NUDIX domain-containing protein n=1 Tax=Nannocystis pusilla TaxID=889268 RepID=A0A9X3EW38_9BACT|nr:NADH pyrophosphatase zinc ribbon domain-containing protein [Nannocystis pusilla]MCY1010410.1 NUDIX domain-containing protein [Nannocystis pusilla]
MHPRPMYRARSRLRAQERLTVPTSARSRNNVFAGLALDRASERRDEQEFIETRRSAATTRFTVVRPDGKALVDAARRGLRQLAEAERAAWLGAAPVWYLGEADEVAHFAVAHASDEEEPLASALGGQWMDLRAAGLALPAFDAGLFAYARGLLHWQSRARFCGACGSPTIFVAAGHKARCTNPACGVVHFPRTDPAIIVIVGWRDACLLGRQASWPPNRYSTLAGFVEPGETLEDAVRREVFEERGGGGRVRLPLVTAVAVPGVADARLHRRGAGPGAARGPGARGRPVVHGRRDRALAGRRVADAPAAAVGVVPPDRALAARDGRARALRAAPSGQF